MSKVNSLTQWTLILIAYLTLFSLGLLDNARGPYFADIISDLSLSDTQAAWFFMMTSGMGFVMGRIVPRLVERFGLMGVVRFGQVMMGLGFASIAWAQSLVTLLLTSTLFGVGFGTLNVAQNLLILEGSSGILRRRLFSGLHAMYAAASLVSPLLASFLFKMNIGWRQAFIGFASIGLVSLASSFLARRSSAPFAETESGLPAAAVDGVSAVVEKDILDAKGEATPGDGTSTSYGVVAGLLSCYIVSELVVTTRLSLYLRRDFDFSPDQASIALAVFFALFLVGRLAFLFFPFRTGSLKIIEWGLISSIVAYGLGLWVSPWFLVVCGLTMSPIFATILNLIAEIFHDDATEALSVCLAISCLYIVSMHLIMGVLTDVVGLHYALYFGFFSLFVAWALLRVTRRENKGLV